MLDCNLKIILQIDNNEVFLVYSINSHADKSKKYIDKLCIKILYTAFVVTIYLFEKISSVNHNERGE